VGGLIGSAAGTIDANPEIKQCYATGAVNVTVLGYASLRVGGLIGYAMYADISECYAAGAVSAYGGDNTREIYTGGLVGYIDAYGSITNCYALGVVFADSIIATGGAGGAAVNTYAGGLVGLAFYTSNYYGGPVDLSISRSFTAGAAVAQSSETNSSVNAGGILANGNYWGQGAYAGQPFGQTDVFNCAALGPSVAVKGSTGRKVGRIFADLANTYTAAVIAKNYALDEMRIESDADYGAMYVTPTYGTGADATSKDGATVSANTFRNSGFWSASYLDFDPAVWNFSTTAGRRHPVLRNVVNAGAQ
jgi:hypothetical protein